MNRKQVFDVNIMLSGILSTVVPLVMFFFALIPYNDTKLKKAHKTTQKKSQVSLSFCTLGNSVFSCILEQEKRGQEAFVKHFIRYFMWKQLLPRAPEVAIVIETAE